MIPPVLTHYSTTNKGVVFLCAPPRPNPREGCKKYIPKIYPPGGVRIKKVWGVFLCFTWNKACGYLSRGRGVK